MSGDGASASFSQLSRGINPIKFPLHKGIVGNMDHPLYGFLPFPDRKSIRLLDLDTSTNEGPINCSLTVYNIDETPSYTALSYTWRFPFKISFPEDKARDRLNPTTKIYCNGEELLVDNNLHACLVQLRKEKINQHLWADAICINQEDKHEKSQHIPLMGEIYAEASKVVVWFGRPHPSWTYVEAASNIVLPYLQSKGDGFYSNRDVYDLNIGDVFDQSFHKVVTEVLKFIADVRWFGRLWVVQEIALAKDGVAQCGHISVPWPKIAKMVTLFTSMGWFTTIHTKEKLWTPEQLEKGIIPTAFHNINVMTDITTKAESWLADGNWYNAPKASPESFLHRLDGFFGTGNEEQALAAWTSYLLHSGAWFSCTVAEDYYYASLGIAARLCNTTNVIVTPNVGAPLVELYTELTAKILSTSRTVAFLAVNGDLARKHHDGIPSWVPDFTSKIDKPNPMSFNGLYLPGMFDASNLSATPAPRSTDLNEGTLTLAGARFDIVASVLDSAADALLNIDDRITELVHFLLSLPAQNHKDQNRVEVLWRTLIFDCEVYFEGLERKYIYPARGTYSAYFCAWWTVKLAALLRASGGSNEGRERIEKVLDILRTDGAREDMVPSMEDVNKYYEQHDENRKWAEKVASDARIITMNAGRLVTERRLYATEKHRVAGMSSLSVTTGDEVWMIRDSAAPLILRPAQGEENRYRLVGEAYVHGFMNGEMLQANYGLSVGNVTLI